ncbi:hypothetical protein [Streptomyces poonensis]|uniref:Uncharacterized protein n=1 Tax=Streptomyces poonensis TaxID=68255 RepID=A0A918PZF8_9ACTN|nr:hypothetical protein [Streptomyces poonensis]GGZ28124.1 hypothetical protein GCM10010365_55580 [Streptomyces poonensis]GLJ89788.1 hypothetical protein GCM10017589_23890 [Streptomyces poonensis]
MIGLTVYAVRKMLWMCMGMLDLMFLAVSLGKVDPKTRKFF